MNKKSKILTDKQKKRMAVKVEQLRLILEVSNARLKKLRESNDSNNNNNISLFNNKQA